MDSGMILAGKYRIGPVLGRGGMGTVTSAFHLQLRQPVAIKFLHSSSGRDGDAVTRLLREAQAVARLRGAHVARVLDLGATDAGAPFIVMEHLDGQDLATRLRGGPLELADAVDIVIQACEGLAEAHALGIVHRDLKPSNLFVTRGPDGSNLVKVLDFGISKTRGEPDASCPPQVRACPGDAIATRRARSASPPTLTSDDSLDDAPVAPAQGSPPAPPLEIVPPTRTEAVLGTPAYMSPEHSRSSKHVDARADIWSLGVVLFELLVGHRPFRGNTAAALRDQIEHEPPPALGSPIPPGLARVVARCLEKDPARRFADVAALADALARFAPAPELARAAARRMARIVGATSSAPGGAATGPRGRRRVVGAALTMVAALAVVAATRTSPSALGTAGLPVIPAPVVVSAPPPAPVMPAPPAVVAAPAPRPSAPATAAPTPARRADRPKRARSTPRPTAPPAAPAPAPPAMNLDRLLDEQF